MNTQNPTPPSLRATNRSEAIQSLSNRLWIASSRPLLAMTPFPKLKLVALCVLCACAVVFSFPSFAAEKERAYERVMRTGVIKCGYGISPPMLVKDPNSGELSGLNYDIWQEIGKDLDLKIEFAVEAGWGSFIEDLKGGRYDAFCSQLWADPGRVKNLSLSTPVIYSLLDAYVRVDDARFDGNIEAINDPAIKLPGIEGDISYSMAQSRFPQAGILSLPQMSTVSDMLLSVTTGKADVLFLDPAMFADFNAKNPGALRKVKDQPPAFVFGSHFAVRAGEYMLRDMIDISLRKMIDDGRLAKLAKKYSADYVVPSKNYEIPK